MANQNHAVSRRVAFSSFIGTTIEWYDYFIYGTIAALVFNKLFFPEISPIVGTMAAFASFAVGFLARPLGGIIFGHFGDKIGRKSTLILSLVIMGLATFAVGLLPSYAQVGAWAPILLSLLRILQGIAIGGEWGGASLMAVEHSPKGKRGLFGSSTQMGAPGGLLISTLVIAIVSRLADAQQFLAWGWRIPFLLSIVLVVVGLVIRLKLEESNAFKQVKEQKQEAKIPLVEVFKTQPKNIFLAAGMSSMNGVSFWIVATFTISYATGQLGLSRDALLNNMIIVAIVYFITIPLFGALSDKVGRKPMIITSVILTALIAFPYFALIRTLNGMVILFAMVLLLSVIQSAAYAPQSAFFAELFEPKVRYTGAALGYNLAQMIFGGTAPLVATALLTAAHGQTWLISLYIIVIACISLISVLFAKETFKKEIDRIETERVIELNSVVSQKYFQEGELEKF